MKNWNANLYDAKHAFVFEYGEGLIDLLAPLSQERILDLGCGTGHLTKQIADTGASVVGFDKSKTMLETARSKYPQIEFIQGDATQLTFHEPFDAVFSNATLHWITDAKAAIKAIYNCLNYNGRFVAEFGGKGNVLKIVKAMTKAIKEVSAKEIAPFWFFPSIGEYAYLLEDCGFEVQLAQLYDRPTILDGATGMKQWIEMFGGDFLNQVPTADHTKIIARAVEILRESQFKTDHWIADYRRLRIVARKI